MSYCLDTNIVIDYLRGNSHTVEFVNSLNGEFYITPLTACELYMGCYMSSKRDEMLRKMDEFTNAVNLACFDLKACRLVAQLHALLSKKGKLSQEIDVMIAAICISNNLTLITSNKKHFKDIPGLSVQYC
jgi:tRNA(fMet)-specific endonuclease VapC